MLTRRFARTKSFILAVFMLISIIMPSIAGLDDTVASARVTQSHIDRLRAEKREYERQKREIQAKIETIEFERMNEMAKKEVLDQRIEVTGLEIKNTNEIIDQYYMLIREKEYEVFLAQDREETQLESYRNRVRAMEENGMITYLEIIFDSTSFSDLLARIDFVNDIMRADETSYINLQVARNETEEAKSVLEEAKAELDGEKEKLEVMEAELFEQLEEAHELIRKMEADLETESERRDQVAAEEDRVQRQINAAVEQLRAQQEAERQRRLQEQRQNASGSESGDSGSSNNSAPPSGGGGTGQLMWPTGGSVSSGFGMRNGRMHQGIDILAPHGNVVVASDSGTVVTSTYGGGYGNYIVISHGNGMTTLYAHLSSRSVSAGTYVSKGQQIGLVGSTGNSTAPHVHLEVSVNGTRVNPMSYL